MTALSQPLTRSVVSPAVAAKSVLWAAILLNVAFVEILFFTSDVPEKNTLITIGRFFGLHVALTMIFQLLLIARLPFLDRRIGMDRLTSWHRWTGFALFWTLLLHVSFIVTGFAQLYRTSIPAQVVSLAGSWPVLLGMVAFVLIATVAVVSARAARRRLSYEAWHAVHFVLYAVIVLALLHQMVELTTFTANSLSRMYWWLLWAFALGALLIGRLILPLVRNQRHRFRVAAVVPESDNVVSVHVTGRHLDKLPARAGQFMLWRFPGHNPWWQVNPFSLSAAPNGASLRLTAKAIGTTSAGLRDLPVGTRVFAEGPYGAFTQVQRRKDATLLIAGGVGVTPIRSLMEELDGPMTVLYRVPSRADAVLFSEIQALASMRGAVVHLLTGRTGEGANPFAAAGLLDLVPDIRDRDVFVCGPARMTDTVLRSLRALKVPRGQVHAERFRLAS
ncbi:MAG TPA: ferric reductase-like transmembrane domain-containing protein [Actinoplanes sp.]|nr:ferric reductase-like transmembrane domain-containing protein [Actinoplanes sp.]